MCREEELSPCLECCTERRLELAETEVQESGNLRQKWRVEPRNFNMGVVLRGLTRPRKEWSGRKHYEVSWTSAYHSVDEGSQRL